MSEGKGTQHTASTCPTPILLKFPNKRHPALQVLDWDSHKTTKHLRLMLYLKNSQFSQRYPLVN